MGFFFLFMVKQVHHGSNFGICFAIATTVPLTELSLKAGRISNLRSTVVFKKMHLKPYFNPATKPSTRKSVYKYTFSGKLAISYVSKDVRN